MRVRSAPGAPLLFVASACQTLPNPCHLNHLRRQRATKHLVCHQSPSCQELTRIVPPCLKQVQAVVQALGCELSHRPCCRLCLHAESPRGRGRRGQGPRAGSGSSIMPWISTVARSGVNGVSTFFGLECRHFSPRIGTHTVAPHRPSSCRPNCHLATPR